MYLSVVVISLLLSSVPAQSRTIQGLTENIPGETGNISEKDDIPVSTIIEINKHTGLQTPLIRFGDIAVTSMLQNENPCYSRGCKWERSRDGNVYVPYEIANHYYAIHIWGANGDDRWFLSSVLCVSIIKLFSTNSFMHSGSIMNRTAVTVTDTSISFIGTPCLDTNRI